MNKIIIKMILFGLIIGHYPEYFKYEICYPRKNVNLKGLDKLPKISQENYRIYTKDKE